MAFPRPRKDVPRAKVGEIVKAMLTNPDVGDVRCREQTNGNYLVVPCARGADKDDDEGGGS